MLGHHHLVGGDDVLARPDRPLQVAAGGFLAADQLDHDLDDRVLQDVLRPAGQQLGRHAPRPFEVADQHPAQPEIDADPLGDRLAAGEHPLGDLRAHGAQPEEADLQFHSRILSESWRLSSGRPTSSGSSRWSR